MLYRIWLLVLCLLVSAADAAGSASAGDQVRVEEKLVLLSTPIPLLAYEFRPVIAGPLPLVVMNHGESLDATERSFFPLVEFRDAAFWFARQGNLVVVPIRPGFARTAIDLPERGLYGLYFGDVGMCSAVNFRDPGIAVATINQWVIDHMIAQHEVLPKGVIVVGQSGGGWGAIALSSLKSASIRAIVTFAAGRGGHVDGKPNNNCAPDRLIAAGGEFGRTANIPMLSIYVHNDSYFGPELSKQVLDAYRAAGGDAEYHLLPDFGKEGHFFFHSADAIPIWSPIVSRFLDQHP
ncbi:MULTISPECIES: dienelactone hydrolase family protein [Bradyrhizobium]|uniref:dienelactone hydrolase family protein n=1 Tax=Bradyrhizobium TaxID=374 RepID=UPI001B89EC82|nr:MULTISPECIES: dienelactone hydrolase [Bradyrhizobium]MBR0973942.1 dienelactone hydrolase [Bradyrhizobium japonicum]